MSSTASQIINISTSDSLTFTTIKFKEISSSHDNTIMNFSDLKYTVLEDVETLGSITLGQKSKFMNFYNSAVIN